MYSTYPEAHKAVVMHQGLSQQEFTEAAQESTLYAVFKAEEYGIDTATITLWLNAMNQTKGA